MPEIDVDAIMEEMYQVYFRLRSCGGARFVWLVTSEFHQAVFRKMGETRPRRHLALFGMPCRVVLTLDDQHKMMKPWGVGFLFAEPSQAEKDVRWLIDAAFAVSRHEELVEIEANQER